jgi:UDP-N-acetylmuramyl pentapeptide phosphotransferase/UDP-N-acetylglucosamine-1-phosphate transferase
VILDLLGGAAIAALVSIIACRILIGAGPLDTPYAERHAHTTPTPTSGGVGIAFGFGVGLMMLALFSPSLRYELSEYGAMLMTLSAVFAYALLLLGFWDDAYPLGARLKFGVFGALALLATWAMGPIRDFPIGDVIWSAPYIFAFLGTALWIFTMVNSVNFMDGANGLAMGSVAIGMTTLGVISLTYGNGTIAGAAEAACGTGALIGFLFWNFPHGRLFAGDSGALFAGGLAALGSMLVIHRLGLSPIVPPIVFFPLLADVLLTLAWRAMRRNSLLDGHSEHLYQIAVHGGMSHGEVALIYWAAMAGCGAIAFMVARDPGVGPWIALAALAIASIVISVVVRRFAGRRGVSGV